MENYKSKNFIEKQDRKVAVKAPCPNQGSLCFCTGACQEIIGWVDKPVNSSLLGNR